MKTRKSTSTAAGDGAAPKAAPKKGSAAVSSFNDLDLERWRELDDIYTDSLWQIAERDRSGAHMADYHGNFVPQIPYQAMRRFTKKGDVVLDAFVGSGTTLIECRRLGRHGIGIELNEHLAGKAAARIERQDNFHKVVTRVVSADACDPVAAPAGVTNALAGIGRDAVQLVILHPPYHSIIKFSDRSDDLSNCPTVADFRQKFGRAVDVVTEFLESGRFLVLVIGDMYSRGEWIPLGFHCMEEVMERGYHLKSIVVKDMQGNRAKRNLEKIWRYRALAGGFYIFKHEYVMFFHKVASTEKEEAPSKAAHKNGDRRSTGKRRSTARLTDR